MNGSLLEWLTADYSWRATSIFIGEINMDCPVSSFDTTHATSPDETTFQALPAEPQRLDRRDFLQLAGGALLLSALPGCGGNSSVNNSTNTAPLTGTVTTQSIAGTISTAQIGGTGLTVGSAYQERATLGVGGAFTTTVSAQGAQLLTLTDAAGQIRALGTSLPGSPLTLDATSTALTLLYMTPGIVSIDLTEAASRLTALQALPSFVALTTFLAKNLPTTSLSALAKGGQLASLKQACITDYLATHRAALRSTHHTRAADDPLGQVTVSAGVKSTDGTPLNFNNSGWRYVSIYRQFLDANDKDLAPYQEANLQGTLNATVDPGLLSGANAISLGSLFTNQIGAAGSGQEKLDLTVPAGLAKVRYWVIGPGLGPIPNPLPFSIPESALSTQSYGATAFYYSFLPLVDFVMGAATSLVKGLEAMAVLWAGLAKGINVTTLVLAFKSGSADNVSLALVDAIVAMATAGLTIFTALGLGGAAATVAAIALTGVALLFDGANAAVALASFLAHPRESAVTFQVQTTRYKVTRIDVGPTNNFLRINNKGQLAGTDGTNGAYFYDGGKITNMNDLLGLTGGNQTAPKALNNKGQMVGQINYGILEGSGFELFIYDSGSGKATLLGRQTYQTVITGFNDSGVMCGYTNRVGATGILLSNGILTPLVPPDGLLFAPLGINASGQVLGIHGDFFSGRGNIALYSNNHFTDLPALTHNGQPTAINDSGQILYSSDRAGMLYTNGVSVPIEFPGQTNSFAVALNASGQVVGNAIPSQPKQDVFDPTVPFIYSQGTMTDLNTLIPADSGWKLNYALGINDSGQICGYGTPSDGAFVNFFLTPV